MQKLEATTGILEDKHVRINALHAETEVVEQDVMTLLFDRMPENLPLPLIPTIPAKLPAPLEPTRLNLVAPLEADIITSSEDREKIVAKMLDALPHAPQARLFYQERSEQIKPSDDATKIAGKRQAIKVGMQ